MIVWQTLSQTGPELDPLYHQVDPARHREAGIAQHGAHEVIGEHLGPVGAHRDRRLLSSLPDEVMGFVGVWGVVIGDGRQCEVKEAATVDQLPDRVHRLLDRRAGAVQRRRAAYRHWIDETQEQAAERQRWTDRHIHRRPRLRLRHRPLTGVSQPVAANCQMGGLPFAARHRVAAIQV
jgi:hypothetical protein